MCFSSKAKTPKTNPEAVKAPEPVLIEEPKGVDFGAGDDTQSDETGVDGLKVKKSDVATDKGDGSSNATAADTGTVKTVKPAASIKRALKR